MTALTALLSADTERIAKLRVRTDHELSDADNVGAATQSSWDNRPTWDNWKKR
jgi:hypothetical protein